MEILSNGSKWMGEKPDSVETLITVLAGNKLDPIFMRHGKFFARMGEGEFMAWGNFENLSHVFDIRGTLQELLPLAKAIKKNRKKFGIR